MQFHMCCNLKTAPNIGELSFVSAIGLLIEWNVPVPITDDSVELMNSMTNQRHSDESDEFRARAS